MHRNSKIQHDLNCDLTRDLTWLDLTWLESPLKIDWLDLTRVTFKNRLTWLDSSQNVQWLEMTRDSKVVTWSQHCHRHDVRVATQSEHTPDIPRTWCPSNNTVPEVQNFPVPAISRRFDGLSDVICVSLRQRSGIIRLATESASVTCDHAMVSIADPKIDDHGYRRIIFDSDLCNRPSVRVAVSSYTPEYNTL